MEAVTTKTLIGIAVLSIVLSLLGHLVTKVPLISMSSLLVAATLFYALIMLVGFIYRSAGRGRYLP
ncbi:hypothetical protein [Rhizobium sp. BK176]|uniref:hypothetical protein n=1 Tax=Rhizobium sp. BK176 TaxID=2587071 RepID=UPI002169F70D|nr:hypothetical protein [Rhizobium sp. BK176]MCS4089380.1 hypothetical protein [Rhizobium sp. BK176]